MFGGVGGKREIKIISFNKDFTKTDIRTLHSQFDEEDIFNSSFYQTPVKFGHLLYLQGREGGKIYKFNLDSQVLEGHLK